MSNAKVVKSYFKKYFKDPMDFISHKSAVLSEGATWPSSSSLRHLTTISELHQPQNCSRKKKKVTLKLVCLVPAQGVGGDSSDGRNIQLYQMKFSIKLPGS